MMRPSLLLELPHPGVNEGVSCVARQVGPELGLILVPRDVDADRVSVHLTEERVVGGHGVEELPPDELGHDGVVVEGVFLLDLVPGVHHGPVELLDADAAELEDLGGLRMSGSRLLGRKEPLMKDSRSYFILR